MTEIWTPLDEFLTAGKEFTPHFGEQTLFELGENLKDLGAKRVEVGLDEDGNSTGMLYVELDDCIPIQMLTLVTSEGPTICQVIEGKWLQLGWK